MGIYGTVGCGYPPGQEAHISARGQASRSCQKGFVAVLAVHVESYRV